MAEARNDEIMKDREKVILLGAGAAGLACALKLSEAGKKPLIYEKSTQIGGLAKTLSFKEGNLVFRTDLGPHRFLSGNKQAYEAVRSLLEKELLTVRRSTRQFIRGKFYDYPIRPVQAFMNIGLFRAGLLLASYLKSAAYYRILRKSPNNFEEHIESQFGKSLGDFCMLNYTEKIIGFPCKKIHPVWANERIAGLNLLSVIRNAVLNEDEESKKDKAAGSSPKSLVNEFHYPRYGIGSIYTRMLDHVSKKGGKLHLNAEPSRIKMAGKKIYSIEFKGGGNDQGGGVEAVRNPSFVVSSIPITELIKRITPLPPKKVRDAAGRLKWRSQIYLFLTLNKRQVTRDNWMYFPDNEIPFGRISEMRNFSRQMSPEGKTSLLVEFFVDENDATWKMGSKQLLDHALPHLERIGFLKKEDVRNHYVIRISHAYPLYDLGFEKNLELVMGYIDKVENLTCIGRSGRFRYNNQDDSIEAGFSAAEKIINRNSLI
ncbi:FAD-dependent oxidoreductase [Candidatus Woesearchaeota archaeon]|nr:FAD-dependent oxidoreductase [Candidatus Woesearchaeota archaeon]